MANLQSTITRAAQEMTEAEARAKALANPRLSSLGASARDLAQLVASGRLQTHPFLLGISANDLDELITALRLRPISLGASARDLARVRSL